jgi:hypothetical protein
VNRIFLSLASLSTILLLVAFGLGLRIEDASLPTVSAQATVSWHFLTAVAALVFAALVHAIVLTYFMGTGRWLEETSGAYSLSDEFCATSRALKNRIISTMAGCLFLLTLTGACGAMADPASPYGAGEWWGISAATIHFLTAAVTVSVNLFVNFWEYQAVYKNGRIVDEVLQEVRRIRVEKGLPVT